MMLRCKILVLCIVFLLYSCGDDCSNNSVVNAPDEISSSEEHELHSSSSKVDPIKTRSSSSVKLEASSSSTEASSSSVKLEASSSSTEASSSSVKLEASSSSTEASSSSVKLDASSSSTEASSSSVMEASSSSLVSIGVCKTELDDRCTYASLYDERDGQTYKTVKIGEQWWMAENLKYNDTTRSECHPDDPNCDIYGRFYERSGALDACPKGWHLPTGEEWLKLSLFVSEHSEGYSGQNLRADFLWDVSGLGPGYDAFGFSALPAGQYELVIGWWKFGKNAVFWLSDSYIRSSHTCYNFARIHYKVLEDNSDMIIGRYGGYCFEYKTEKLSVRCIKDD